LRLAHQTYGRYTLETSSLGRKIQQLRLNRRLSLRKVATEAGITPSMLSQIENDQTNPSINTLRSIAHVLSAPLYTLFLEDAAPTPVVHPEERRTIGTKSTPDIRYELLTRDTKGEIEFCMMIIPPSLDSYGNIQSHAGEEVAYILSGDGVELDLDGKLFLMNTGDSIRIPTNTPHAWRNASDTTAQIIFAVTPPEF